jgi:hypothetical protein
MKTIDLSDLKVGDNAWDYQLGLITVTEICKGNDYCVGIDGGEYTIDGRVWINDQHPTLFHSKEEFLKYWSMESNQLTKRELKIIDKMVERAIDLITKLNEK